MAVTTGFQDTRPDTQKQNDPQVPEGQIQNSPGQPTTAPLCRGVYANSSIAIADLKRQHVCSFTAKMNFDLSGLKADMLAAIKALRTQIEGLFASTQSSPFVEEIKQQVAALQAKIKLIKKEIDAQLAKLEALKEYQQELQKLIDEINSLPAELMSLYQSCLSDAQSSLSEVTSQINQVVGEINTAVASAQSQVTALAQQGQQVANQTINTVIPKPPG